jgi:hypothetical protein
VTVAADTAALSGPADAERVTSTRRQQPQHAYNDRD